jgi:hypothetical protein
MSQKSQADLHESAAAAAMPEGAAETAPSNSPVVMITSASEGVYVTDQQLTKWERISPPTDR